MPCPRFLAARSGRRRDRLIRPGSPVMAGFGMLAAFAVPASVVLFASTPAPARATRASAKDGQLSAFSGGISQAGGTLSAKRDPDGGDTWTFSASYRGRGARGLASGSFKVSWKQGEHVIYGAAFFLPRGFHSARQGQQALLTWDTRRAIGGRFAQSGVVIDYRDNLAYLIRAWISGGALKERVLAGPFALPIGRWFTLRVRQRLGSGRSADSRVYENGRLIAASRAPNFSGGRIDHVRYGIVQLSAAARQGHVSLEFDRAMASPYSTYVNPFTGDAYSVGRTDMGVDVCLKPGEPIRAVGDGMVKGIKRNWFSGEPYVWYRLSDGPYAGRYVYVAEQIRSLARVGTKLAAGQPVAYYNRWGTCIETGWSAAGGATLAQATSGYYEGQVTGAGISFAGFLVSLGVHGRFEL